MRFNCWTKQTTEVNYKQLLNRCIWANMQRAIDRSSAYRNGQIQCSLNCAKWCVCGMAKCDFKLEQAKWTAKPVFAQSNNTETELSVLARVACIFAMIHRRYRFNRYATKWLAKMTLQNTTNALWLIRRKKLVLRNSGKKSLLELQSYARVQVLKQKQVIPSQRTVWRTVLNHRDVHRRNKYS